MSETDTRSSPSGRPGRGIKIALAISVALNLLVVGLTVGAVLRGGPGHDRSDLGMGPLSEALSREDRRALRKDFLDRHPDIRGDRQAMKADFDVLLAALRAEPFDPLALDAALAQISARNAELLSSGRDLVALRLKAMDPEARAAFADRLEEKLGRLGRRDDKDREEKDRDEKDRDDD
ncbi:MAG: periplasmic heavy metal sensor [Paracoccaceae bacterium]